MPFSEEAKAEIRAIIDEQLKAFLQYGLKAFEQAEPRPTPPAPATAPATDVLTKFPVELKSKLYFDELGNIRLKDWVGTEIWTQINKVANDNGYKYVKASNGQKAHWSKAT